MKRSREEVSDAGSPADGEGGGERGVSEYAKRAGEAAREARRAVGERIASAMKHAAAGAAAARPPPAAADLAVYKALMEREPFANLCAARAAGREEGGSAPVLPLVSKSYEDGYMREARAGSGERPCIAGERCECILMAAHPVHRRAQPFIGREFLLPEDETRWRATGVLPPQRGLCLPCIRKHAMLWYYDLVAKDEDARTVLQTHRNMVGVPGEYAASACLYPHDRRFYGITDPLVEHQVNRYQYCVLPDGSKALRQVGVDFREA